MYLQYFANTIYILFFTPYYIYARKSGGGPVLSIWWRGRLSLSRSLQDRRRGVLALAHCSAIASGRRGVVSIWWRGRLSLSRSLSRSLQDRRRGVLALARCSAITSGRRSSVREGPRAYSAPRRAAGTCERLQCGGWSCLRNGKPKTKFLFEIQRVTTNRGLRIFFFDRITRRKIAGKQAFTEGEKSERLTDFLRF